MSSAIVVEVGQQPDELVPDPKVQQEFGVSAMTLWRWDRDPTLEFPPPIKIRKRNYRSRYALDAFKQRMLRAAIAMHSRGAKCEEE